MAKQSNRRGFRRRKMKLETEVKECVWFKSSTDKETYEMKSPDSCKNCDGKDKYCEKYIVR